MLKCRDKFPVIVLDLVSQSCDVVLVRRTFSSGKPQGVGIVRYHCGGWSEEVNSCILISHMVYL